MKLNININGEDISGAFNLTPLDGTLNALLKPATPKKLVTNENSAIDGVMYVSTPSKRFVDKREISLSFLCDAEDLVNIPNRLQEISSFLTEGYNSSGVNEVFIEELQTTFYLIYNGITSFSTFGLNGKCKITIKFTEPDPNNRA